MLEFLKVHHYKTISLSTLKRYLKKVDCFNRPLLERRITFNEVKEILQEALNGRGSNLVYRGVWSHLGTSGKFLRGNDVGLSLWELNRKEINKRQRQQQRWRKYLDPGASYVRHIDCQDKLKFILSSKHIIWLDVAAANNCQVLSWCC